MSKPLRTAAKSPSSTKGIPTVLAKRSLSELRGNCQKQQHTRHTPNHKTCRRRPVVVLSSRAPNRRHDQQCRASKAAVRPNWHWSRPVTHSAGRLGAYRRGRRGVSACERERTRVCLARTPSLATLYVAVRRTCGPVRPRFRRVSRFKTSEG